jgi:protein-disulfide isomerase
MQKKILFPLSFLFALASSSALAVDAEQEKFNKMMDSYLSTESNLGKIGDALESHFRKKQDQQRVAAQQAEEQRAEQQFKNPVKVEIGSSPVMGKADAKVTIVEFSDFQCPFCSRGKAIVDEVAKQYGDKVKVVFKHLPLPMHSQAEPAARASIAAQNQGKFWEMHDLLFENQQNLNEEEYKKFAKQLGLDMAKFEADYKSDKAAKQVQEDMKLATSLGVNGTPGFFINGVELQGAQPPQVFKKIIDRWLAETKK